MGKGDGDERVILDVLGVRRSKGVIARSKEYTMEEDFGARYGGRVMSQSMPHVTRVAPQGATGGYTH